MTPPRGTALEIAAAVRGGDRPAADVVDEHLAAIEAREAEIHAFNLVLGEGLSARQKRMRRGAWVWPRRGWDGEKIGG